jgi:pyridoxal phosphate-dependent aminotransferase EpsN
MSNILAGIGRGQLAVLEQRVQARRRNFACYEAMLGHLPGLHFMPEASWGRASRWLTVVTFDGAEFGAGAGEVRLALERDNIEARPVWKPLHLQPVFASCEHVGGAVAEEFFAKGLCLPSGSNLSDAELVRVADTVCAASRYQRQRAGLHYYSYPQSRTAIRSAAD